MNSLSGMYYGNVKRVTLPPPLAVRVIFLMEINGETDQLDAGSTELSNLAKDLNEMVGKFKV